MQHLAFATQSYSLAARPVSATASPAYHHSFMAAQWEERPTVRFLIQALSEPKRGCGWWAGVRHLDDRLTVISWVYCLNTSFLPWVLSLLIPRTRPWVDRVGSPYRALGSGTSFRVLVLEPEGRSGYQGPLKGRLKHVSSFQEEDYDALSYA